MLSVDQIRKYPLFSGLDDSELDNLSGFMTKRAFVKDAYIFYPGSPCVNTYILESGLVRLFYVDASGKEFLLNLVQPCNLFGFPLLEDNQFRLTGAAACQPTVVLTISKENLIQLMENSPHLILNLYEELIINSRKLILHIRSLVTLGLQGRLAAILLRISRLDKNQVHIINLPISQEDLARWLGASRGRLNQALSLLQKQGLIHVDQQTITILDFPGLKQMTENQILDQV